MTSYTLHTEFYLIVTNPDLADTVIIYTLEIETKAQMNKETKFCISKVLVTI
jgi:hypothetical protein